MRRVILSAAVLGLTAGCGGSQPPTESAATTPATSPSTNVVAQPLKTADAGSPDQRAAPAPNTPEALIREVTRLAATTLKSQTGAESVGLSPAGKVSLQPIADTALAAAERKRQSDIVQLSMEVIVRTKDDPEKQQLFNNAVHYLSAAQMKLALEGDADSERRLMETAESLRQRDAESFAAVEAAAKVVELARLRAERESTPELANAYARQARFFATEFRHEVSRAAVALLQAGRWCEDHGFFPAAADCYTAIATDFPNSLFAANATGAARRASLVGEPLRDFGGPTIDGGFVRPEHYAGRPMAIVFWTPTDETVPELFAELDAARKANDRLALIGVCLGEDERMASAAVEYLPTCAQIYTTNADERGFKNPLARHYGIDHTPVLWLVGSDGVVQTVAGKASAAKTLR